MLKSTTMNTEGRSEMRNVKAQMTNQKIDFNAGQITQKIIIVQIVYDVYKWALP